MQSMLIPLKVCDEIDSLVKKFIWGSFVNKRTMSLVGWDSICQPKGCDDLSLRKLEDLNYSFLLKLGFSIVYGKESLWVRIIRAKYQMTEALLESISRHSSSFIWKVLSSIWPLLRENLI